MAENYVPEDKSESGEGGLKSTEPVEGYFNLYVQRAKNVYTRPYLSRFNQSDINEVNSEAKNNSAVGGYVLLERIVRDKYAKRPAHDSLVQQQVQTDEKANKQVDSKELSKGGAPNAASPQEWDGAWKDKQMEQRLKGNTAKDPTHPDPLLVDKIGSLPPGSPRRNCYENIKGVVENSTANIGSGTDSITRESYKELQMIVKASPMLEAGVNPTGKDPVGPPSKDNLLGVENQTVVNNLQSWEATLTNAVKPISDAIGSHADANSSVNKGPMGTDQMLPQAAIGSSSSNNTSNGIRC